jgi:mRNA interferase MazF
VAVVVDKAVTQRFDIFLINLDPTVGREIQKTRPCLIVSPDEMNQHLATVIIAPLTSKRRGYPSRVPCRFKRKLGEIALDQIRTVDKIRLVRRIGAVDRKTQLGVVKTLAQIFAL